MCAFFLDVSAVLVVYREACGFSHPSYASLLWSQRALWGEELGMHSLRRAELLACRRLSAGAGMCACSLACSCLNLSAPRCFAGRTERTITRRSA